MTMQPGTYRAALEISRKIGDSALRQEIVLTADSPYIEFVTQIDWQERHKLLKVAFPVNANAKEAIHEIQFGYVKRPTTARIRRIRTASRSAIIAIRR